MLKRSFACSLSTQRQNTVLSIVRTFTFDILPVGADERRAGTLRSAALRGDDFEHNARFVKCSGRI
jgi:hypothetical protein